MNRQSQLNPDIRKAEEPSHIKIGNILLIEYLDIESRVSRASGFVSDHKEEVVELSYVDPNQSVSNLQLANPIIIINEEPKIGPICLSAIHGIHNTTFSIKPNIRYSDNYAGKVVDYSQRSIVLSQNYRSLKDTDKIDENSISIGDLVFMDGNEVNICGFVTEKTTTHLRLSHFDPNSYLTKNAMIIRFTPHVRNQPDLDFRMSRFHSFYRLINAYEDTNQSDNAKLD
jgi:hypothetical protein